MVFPPVSDSAVLQLPGCNTNCNTASHTNALVVLSAMKTAAYAAAAPPPLMVSLAQYTSRDVILYALGIGCCADSSDEIQYVYENHHDFAPLPSFPLALSFAALPAASDASSFAGIRPFPPHTMENTLPRQFIAADSDFDPSSCPILHIAQSLRLHKPIPMPDLTEDNSYDHPVRVQLVTTILSVSPKDIGTFVTTETKYRTATGPSNLLFTGTSTALVVGAPKEAVLSFQRGSNKQSDVFDSIGALGPKRNRQIVPPSFEAIFRINPNQALLYRLSGDYNAIHVDLDLAAMAIGNHNRKGEGESVSRPVLHGLCSLGFAVRGVLRFLRQREAAPAITDAYAEVTYLSCRFARPIYVGDKIKVVVWDDDGSSTCNVKEEVLRFEVLNCASGKTVIKDGIAAITARTSTAPDKTPSTSRSRSRL